MKAAVYASMFLTLNTTSCSSYFNFLDKTEYVEQQIISNYTEQEEFGIDVYRDHNIMGDDRNDFMVVDKDNFAIFYDGSPGNWKDRIKINKHNTEEWLKLGSKDLEKVLLKRDSKGILKRIHLIFEGLEDILIYDLDRKSFIDE